MKNTNEMNKTLNLHRNIITFGIPISILLVLILVMKSTVLSGNDTLILAISADLLLTVPLVYFYLFERQQFRRQQYFL